MTETEKKHCLLIEDLADDALQVHKQFESHGGYELQWVKDGQEAVHYLESKPPYTGRKSPDVILLDLKLPVMDGFAFLEWRNTRSEHGRTPVLVMSALTSPADIRRAYDLGVSSYLTKPLNWNHFRHEVSRLLSGSPAPQQMAARRNPEQQLKRITCTLTFKDGKKVTVTAAARTENETVRFDYAGDTFQLRPLAETGTLPFLQWYMHGMAANLDAHITVTIDPNS